MEENNNTKTEVIDLRLVFKKIWNQRRLFYKVLPIVFILSCIYIFSVPRYYTSSTNLAPELDPPIGSNTLSSLASTLGFDFNEMQTTDAITPLLYPDLMDDNGFVSSLMSITVASLDGEINTTYYDYLLKHQKQPWWSYPIQWLKSFLPKDEEITGSKGTYNPYHISKTEDNIFNAARQKIKINIDKKTGVISISVESQDPLICKTLADSVTAKLQIFITAYRTNKARIDYEYYKELTAEAKADYDKARHDFATMSDASTHISLQSVKLKLSDVERDMQMKYSTYNTLNNQLQAAKAKVQERTPAFTILKGASVPIKPAGPKRMIFVAAMLILALISICLYSIYDLIIKE